MTLDGSAFRIAPPLFIEMDIELLVDGASDGTYFVLATPGSDVAIASQ